METVLTQQKHSAELLLSLLLLLQRFLDIPGQKGTILQSNQLRLIEATKHHFVISASSPIAKDQAVRPLQTLDTILFYIILLHVLAESLMALSVH